VQYIQPTLFRFIALPSAYII